MVPPFGRGPGFSFGGDVMRSPFATLVLLSLAIAGGSRAAPPASHPRKPAQSAIASKTASVASVTRSDASYRGALAATDLDGAAKQKGKTVALKGTVVKVFAPESHNLVILNFAEDYKKAVSAVVFKEDFARFPDLDELAGKEV